MLKWLEATALSVLLVFAPIHQAVIVTAVLVIADLITGILAAKKQGIPITSSGIKRTVGKILLYEIALMLAFLVQKYMTGDDFMAAKIVSAMVGITELKSCLENLSIITGSDIIKKLLDVITKAKPE